MPSSRTRARRALAVTLLAVTAALAACSDDGGNDDEGSVEAFCARAANLEDTPLVGIEVADPEAMATALEETRDDLEELVASAPDDPDLTGPLGDAENANRALADLLADIDLDDTDGFAALIGDLQARSDELTSATQEVQAWVAEHCTSS